MSDSGLILSILVPVYNELENIEPLVQRISGVLEALDAPYEIILIDDGSSDGSESSIRGLAERISSVRGVFLARNYGQSTALQAGFDQAEGELIVTLDADLQNDPSDIPHMLQLLESDNLDVVCGWRRDRLDSLIRKLFSKTANRLIRRLTHVDVNDFGCTLRVYRRDVVQDIQLFGEMHRFLPALLTDVGARVGQTVVTHHPRLHGRSKYSLDRTFRVFLDLLLVVFFRKYVQRPLHLFGGLGLMSLLPGGAALLYLATIKIFFGESIGERPLLSLGVLLVLLGAIMLGLGLLGELITRTLHHPNLRPQYILRRERNGAPLRKWTLPDVKNGSPAADHVTKDERSR